MNGGASKSGFPLHWTLMLEFPFLKVRTRKVEKSDEWVV
jgi:hypothetical protein